MRGGREFWRLCPDSARPMLGIDEKRERLQVAINWIRSNNEAISKTRIPFPSIILDGAMHIYLDGFL